MYDLQFGNPAYAKLHVPNIHMTLQYQFPIHD